jgi:hypothetical protein
MLKKLGDIQIRVYRQTEPTMKPPDENSTSSRTKMELASNSEVHERALKGQVLTHGTV